MSHPLCVTDVGSGNPNGWVGWNGKAIYIKSIIDPSVQHVQACGEAIRRWNESVGARFLIVPDQGDHTITFVEKTSQEQPFIDYPHAAGLAYLYLNHPKIFIRSDQVVTYHQWVNYYAHEIGHTFGLADHPIDDINSLMSYQNSGRWLLRPSKEDIDSILGIHGLQTMKVKPEDLEGIENITGFWQWDRYENHGWKFWLPHLRKFSTIDSLVPYEVYKIKAKIEGLLGYGRFSLFVSPKTNLWVYL